MSWPGFTLFLHIHSFSSCFSIHCTRTVQCTSITEYTTYILFKWCSSQDTEYIRIIIRLTIILLQIIWESFTSLFCSGPFSVAIYINHRLKSPSHMYDIIMTIQLHLGSEMGCGTGTGWENWKRHNERRIMKAWATRIAS